MIFAGSKGGSSAFKQTPDNLRSNDLFEGVLGLCVGPIKGPTRGLKSINVNETAIENETGQLNFQDFTATIGDGDPLKFPQTVQLKLGASGAPFPVNIALTNNGGTTTGWVTRTLTSLGADFIDLRFVVQQLFRQDAKGIYSATATIEIEMKPVGSTTWINPTIGTPTQGYQESGYVLPGGARVYSPRQWYDLIGNHKPGGQNYAINGKTTSPAVYELRINVPNEGAYAGTGWDVRCRLIERDSYTGGKDNVDQEQRTITWESLSGVYGNVMGQHEDWRGLAWMQIYGKASDALNSWPEISGIYDTKIISVPAGVYNPETRQYSGGVWDGSWARAYCNDPAWVINDAISDGLSGLALIAQGSHLNKWDALELSKHCCELVPDGDGGLQPRYSLNLAVSEPQKAEEFIRYLAGAVGALAWDQGDGEWRVKVDKLEDPVDIFTLDNIEGEFLYSHTDVDTRHNDIIGQFKNEDKDFASDSVRLFDNQSIARIGRKPTTLVLVGCTNLQEACRRVMIRLRAAVNENKNVNFTTNRRGRAFEPLTTILIADGDLADQDQRSSGRMVQLSADRKTMTLGDTVYLAPGVNYVLRFTVFTETGTIVERRTIVNSLNQRGATKELVLSEPLPVDVDDNLVVALEAPGLPGLPLLYRITNVNYNDDGERVSISAVIIDTGKWVAADNVTKAATVFQDLRGTPPPPTSQGNVLSLHTSPSETGVITSLMAEWIRPSSPFIGGFRVQHSVNDGPLTTVVENSQFTSWEITNPPPGRHHVEISSISRTGAYSAPLVAEANVLTGPDQTRPSLGQIWRDGAPFNPDPGTGYVKGDLVVHQGATWIFTSDLQWDGTAPPALPVESNAWWRMVKDGSSFQLTIDNALIFVSADSEGNVLDGQLPKLGQARYVVGNAEVTSSTTWSIVGNNCTAEINSTGGWTISAMDLGTSAYAEVTGAFNGTSATRRIQINKNVSGVSQGAAGEVQITAFGTISSQSYADSPITIASIDAGAGGIQLSGRLLYDIGSSRVNVPSYDLAGKLVYRPVGGSWTDAHPEIRSQPRATGEYYGSTSGGGGNTGPQPIEDGEPGGPLPGQTGILTLPPVAVSGLTAGAKYEFGVLLRRYSSTVATSTTPYGSIKASPA